MLTNYHVLTNSGQNIITRSLVENKSIEFTSYKVGDGDVATIDEIKLLTDIKGNLIKKFGVAKTSKVSNSTTSVSGQYDNSDIVVATQVKEYALFAKLEGESSEVLFSYQGLGNGFILPSYTGTLLTQVVDFTITMTQDVGVVVRFNPSALVDMQTFFEELDKKVDKTAIKSEQLTNTVTDLLSSSASRNLFENGAGGKCLGYIEDGGQHTPHETNFWISKKVNGQFRCVVSNSDNYIDADKWLPIDDNSNASKLKNLSSLITYIYVPIDSSICMHVIKYDLGDKYYIHASGRLLTRTTYDFSLIFDIIASIVGTHSGSDTRVNIVTKSTPLPSEIYFGDSYSEKTSCYANITGFKNK